MNIPADHPEAGSLLLQAACRAFVGMGASVSVLESGENMLQLLPDQGVAVVHAQGLRNLMHELGHAVLSGTIADDYGIDYRAIPFDLTTAAGRSMLWDELACCAMSCQYLQAELSRAGVAATQGQAIADAWFAEQVEIQPVFYGMEDDPDAFVVRVGQLLADYDGEAEAVVERARVATEEVLRAAGASSAIASPSAREALAGLWGRATQHRADATHSA